ncbi:hypothetical protein JOE48_001343 [Methylobacterium sp. PvR107]|nr:hypothetical protein [Methylobacterium sp. PvR107]
MKDRLCSIGTLSAIGGISCLRERRMTSSVPNRSVLIAAADRRATREGVPEQASRWAEFREATGAELLSQIVRGAMGASHKRTTIGHPASSARGGAGVKTKAHAKKCRLILRAVDIRPRCVEVLVQSVPLFGRCSGYPWEDPSAASAFSHILGENHNSILHLETEALLRRVQPSRANSGRSAIRAIKTSAGIGIMFLIRNVSCGNNAAPKAPAVRNF